MAEHCIAHGVDTLFRVHGAPNEDKLAEFVAAAEKLGVSSIDTAGVRELSQSLDVVADADVKELLSMHLLRAMMKAEYQTKLHGHYGLGFSAYLHFTSPIRRYPDLVTHRVIRNLLRKQKGTMKRSLSEIGAQSNRRERLALEAERDVVAMYKCLWLKPRIGELFDGFVTHVSPKGAFIKLGGTHCDGFLPFESRGTRRPRRGSRRRQVFEQAEPATMPKLEVGERLQVRLVNVNVTRRRVELGRTELSGEDV